MNHNGNQSYEWSHLGNNNKATLNHPLYPLRQTMRDCSPLSLIKSDFTFVSRSRGNFPIAGQDFRPCNVTRCSSALCATNVNHSFTWFPVDYLSKWRRLIKTSAVLWSNSRNQSIGNRLIDTRFAWLINGLETENKLETHSGGKSGKSIKFLLKFHKFHLRLSLSTTAKAKLASFHLEIPFECSRFCLGFCECFSTYFAWQKWFLWRVGECKLLKIHLAQWEIMQIHS